MAKLDWSPFLNIWIAIFISWNVRVKELDAQNVCPIYIIFCLNIKFNECEEIGHLDLSMPINLPQNHFFQLLARQKWRISQFTNTEYQDMLSIHNLCVYPSLLPWRQTSRTQEDPWLRYCLEVNSLYPLLKYGNIRLKPLPKYFNSDLYIMKCPRQRTWRPNCLSNLHNLLFEYKVLWVWGNWPFRFEHA